MLQNTSKLYPRVRPYLAGDALNSILREEKVPSLPLEGFWSKCFFFNSARSGLRWLLSTVFPGAPRKVGVQVFTCSVVIEAIRLAGHEPVFIDISPSFFSTSVESVYDKKIDILILTHLFGIPNPHYSKIITHCRNNNIFVIEDLALALSEHLDEFSLGEAGDAAIYSFGFDKPVSCYAGGALRVNDVGIRESLSSNYNALPRESETHGYCDLSQLRYYWELFDPSLAKLNGAYSHPLPPLFGTRSNFRLPSSLVQKIGTNRVLNILSAKVKGLQSTTPKRLALNKITYLSYVLPMLHSQQLIWRDSAHRAKWVLETKFPEIIFPPIFDSEEFYCHRLAVRVPSFRNEFIDKMISSGVEAGVFNWPNLASPDVLIESFPGASKVLLEIVNIPLWSNEIWQTDF